MKARQLERIARDYAARPDLPLFKGDIANGGWSGNEQQEAKSLNKILNVDASTLKTWYPANC